MNWLDLLRAGESNDFLAALGIPGHLVNLSATGEGDAYRVYGLKTVVAAEQEWMAAVVLAAEHAANPPERVLAAAAVLLGGRHVEVLSREASP